jgi:hypothetical protein
VELMPYGGVFQDGVAVAGGATMSDVNFLAVFGPPAAPVAPSVVPSGTTAATTMGYKFVAVSANGDSPAGAPTSITNSQPSASLTGTNKNTVTGTAVTSATSYKLLRSEAGVASGAYQLLKSGLSTPNYVDTGADNGGIAAYARSLPPSVTLTPNRNFSYVVNGMSLRFKPGVPAEVPYNVWNDIVNNLGFGS